MTKNADRGCKNLVDVQSDEVERVCGTEYDCLPVGKMSHIEKEKPL